MNPFEHIDDAFLPFFADTIKVTTKDGKTMDFVVSVFEDIDSDPLNEDNLETDERNYVFVLFNMTPPEKISRGDSVVFKNNFLKVKSVEDDFALGTKIICR